ncbi:hypothetical protein DFW101_1868 [Solidesulfovibrio carbinoliphilus subsp. oakridgensis]|uniref:FeS-binding protein n=1 Tax=Solidesulfovibrio carbinoliphilus subsp. oakridgensis TaxID=694327 RepID=G7QA45_9BACT|nr:hypothetical protein [Solidesulfovibrio carbinoliphilus]EHJ47875.1 hypothetical protein DFW101_1868 [Solidesulfovibrio carbinoliphilus subsp. oakridgensis]
MASPLFPRWQRRLVLAASLGLGLTGLGQMPVFARYGVAAIPGLGWLGDFRSTASLHLALAAVLLVAVAALATVWLGAGSGRPRLTGPGWCRVALYGGLAGSGLLRVLENGPAPFMPPGQVRFLDWTHLGLALALGAFALWRGRRPALAAKAPAGRQDGAVPAGLGRPGKYV